jgi:hypothetical protein
LAGCGSTSASRVAQVQTVLTVAQAQADTVRNVVNQFETAANEAQAILSEPNLPASVRTTILQKAVEAQAQLDKYRPTLASLETRVGQLQDLLTQAQAAGTDLDLGQELQTYGQGLSVTSGALPPPVDFIVGLIGVAMTLVGGAIGSVARAKKAKADLAAQQRQSDDIVGGIVGSVNALLASPAVADPAAAKAVLQEYQVQNAPAARVAVRKAQGLAA